SGTCAATPYAAHAGVLPACAACRAPCWGRPVLRGRPLGELVVDVLVKRVQLRLELRVGDLARLPLVLERVEQVGVSTAGRLQGWCECRLGVDPGLQENVELGRRGRGGG